MPQEVVDAAEVDALRRLCADQDQANQLLKAQFQQQAHALAEMDLQLNASVLQQAYGIPLTDSMMVP